VALAFQHTSIILLSLVFNLSPLKSPLLLAFSYPPEAFQSPLVNYLTPTGLPPFTP
jgi:hypothetical protein